MQEVLEWKAKIAGWGYEPVICSVRSRSGVAPVVELLKEKTAVVVGPSGVGKSSLINALRDVSGIEMWREREAMERLENLASEEHDAVIIPQVCSPLCILDCGDSRILTFLFDAMKGHWLWVHF